MNKNIQNRFVLIADYLLITVSVLGSYLLRFELTSDFVRFYLQGAFWFLGIALVVKPIVYYFFGLYRRLWIYASVNELKVIALAVTTSSLVVSVIFVTFFWLGVFGPGLSRSVLAIDWLLSILLIGGMRFTLRLLAESGSPRGTGKVRKIIVIGAGDAGALVVKEMQKNRQISLEPVGFLDDDPAKQNHSLLGVPVIGKLTDLARALDEREVDEVIIAIPSAPGRVVRLVADVCRLKSVPFRTMPGIYELLGGKVNVSRLREVEITDLLRREPVRIHEELIGQVLNGKDYPNLDLIPVIADVRDSVRLQAVFDNYAPEVVFHAAAHKHVPLMQINVEEAVANNILATQNVVRTADRCGVQRLVLISTDKAVHPANVYGATKRMAEMIVLDAALRSGKAFSVVRFGNVLGSRGSVVPLFKRMIASGG
ncbi:MAG: polysaccharide biosynthesis protein, partial [Chloroflexi bacterium]|nr:polysaccharide biosynthesis protein [Chloroflexota bacterium]